MTRTYERFMCGDMDLAREQAASAIELGRAHDVNPAVVIGMTASARIRIFDGDVDGGLTGAGGLHDLVQVSQASVDSVTAGLGPVNVSEGHG